MKYLGIDYGTKRIGLATSDEGGSLAFPLAVVEAGPKALSEVAAYIEKEGAKKIILGESRNFKNEANPLQEDIEQFKKDLEGLTTLPVEFEPEFMTSALAAREGETKDIDSSAAALILQSYLDRMRHNG